MRHVVVVGGLPAAREAASSLVNSLSPMQRQTLLRRQCSTPLMERCAVIERDLASEVGLVVVRHLRMES